MKHHVWMICLLIACAGDEGEADGPVVQLEGTIQENVTRIEGEVAIYHGFAFDQGGVFISYLSSNPESDCDSITDYLQDHSGYYDPSDVLVGGACDIYYKISSAYEGEIAASDDPMVAAGMAINCYMGEGGWILETRDSDDTDYYWQGEHWQGHPTGYDLSLTGGDGSGYSLDLNMTEYDGNFIYEDFDNDPASGSVSGTVELDWCPGLGTTPLF